MRVLRRGPDDAEIAAYIVRLRDLRAAGANVTRVQVYTVSRPPAERFVSSLTPAEVDAIAEQCGRRFPDCRWKRTTATWDAGRQGQYSCTTRLSGPSSPRKRAALLLRKYRAEFDRFRPYHEARLYALLADGVTLASTVVLRDGVAEPERWAL